MTLVSVLSVAWSVIRSLKLSKLKRNDSDKSILNMFNLCYLERSDTVVEVYHRDTFLGIMFDFSRAQRKLCANVGYIVCSFTGYFICPTCNICWFTSALVYVLNASGCLVEWRESLYRLIRMDVCTNDTFEAAWSVLQLQTIISCFRFSTAYTFIYVQGRAKVDFQ